MLRDAPSKGLCTWRHGALQHLLGVWAGRGVPRSRGTSRAPAVHSRQARASQDLGWLKLIDLPERQIPGSGKLHASRSSVPGQHIFFYKSSHQTHPVNCPANMN